MFDVRLLTWVPLCLYTIGALPQLIKSLRERSAAGVSQLMVFLRITGLSFYTIYTYRLNLTMAYKVMLPTYV